LPKGEEVIGEDADPAIKDAALISAAQRVEHYEMAGYGSARAFCQAPRPHRCRSLLQQTLDEEGAADEKLGKIADSTSQSTRQIGLGKRAASRLFHPAWEGRFLLAVLSNDPTRSATGIWL